MVWLTGRERVTEDRDDVGVDKIQEVFKKCLETTEWADQRKMPYEATGSSRFMMIKARR